MRNTALAAIVLSILALAGAAQAAVTEVRLTEFTPDGAVRLTCLESRFSLLIPVPERWDIKRVTLKLKWHNSINVLPTRSQIAVRWQDHAVFQKALQPRDTEVEANIDVPVRLLKPGYNTLGIAVAQHYKDQCENFCPPEIWTTLQLHDSSVEFEYELAEVPLALSRVSDFLFDPRLFSGARVHVVMEDMSEGSLTAAAVVASGVARRFDYRPVSFSASSRLVPGLDNILVGSEAFVSAILNASGLEARPVTGPTLRMLHMPGQIPAEKKKSDTRHALIVVTSKKGKGLKIAAETFANLTFPYPGTDELVAIEFSLPDIPLYGGRLVLRSDQEYAFETLNFPTTTFLGMNPPSKGIAFRLPADFMIKHNRAATLVLDFSYGAGMRPESALNIMINGKHVRAIHLNNAGGEFIDKYTLTLPAHLFKPGSNVIEFSPVLAANIKECDIIQSGNLFLTIQGTSTLTFPEMPHFVELPSLELFMLNGFPLTRWPDGFEAMLYVPKPTDETVAAALDVLGLITQRNGYPLFGITVSPQVPSDWKGEIMILGPADAIAPELLKGAPLTPGAETTLAYPVITNWDNEVSLATSRQRSGLGPDTAVMMQYQSPLVEGRSVFVLTAATSARVHDLSEALLMPTVQGGVWGGMVLVEFDSGKPVARGLRVGTPYFTGKEGSIGAVDFIFFSHPAVLYFVIGAGILLLSGLVYFIIRRRRKAGADAGSENAKK